MNFKNLILSTILLLSNPITLCAEDIDLEDLLELQFLETKHEKYLNNRKIPIYSDFSKHQSSIDQPTKQLMQAILDPHSNLATVQVALNAGANPNVNYFTGYDGMCGGGSKHHYQPALMIAIEQRRFDITEALILTGTGADVNLPSWERHIGRTVMSPAFYETTYTPLTKLIANLSTKPELETAQLNLVKLLLEHGANIDTPAIFINHAEGAEVTTTEKYTALKLLMKKDCFMPVWYRTCGGYWQYSIYEAVFCLLNGFPVPDEKFKFICYGYCHHIS